MNTHILMLDGLECPHCAAKIEAEIKKRYSDTVFSFINKQLKFTSDKNTASAIKEIQGIVDSIEDGVTVKVFEETEEEEEKDGDFVKKGIIRIILGGIALGIGIFAENGLPFFIFAYIVFGYDVIFRALKNICRGRLFDENFLMSLATVGAFVIGEYTEAVAVMLFYQIGEFFQDMAVDNSRRSIKELMDLKVEEVTVLKDGKTQISAPENVLPEDIIIVKPGEKIALDSIVIEGSSNIDTSALTGESVPVFVSQGDEVKSGAINKESVLKLKVEKPYKDSTIVKIMEMAEAATANKSRTENMITKFAMIYTPIVVIAAVLLFAVPTLVLGNYSVWLKRSLIFLVSSCPCALVVSIPLTFFSGIGSASRKGVLIKGSNFLQMLADVDTVVYDKTGTVTKGSFKAVEYTDEKTLYYASGLERYSNHPLAKAVTQAYTKQLPEASEVTEISGYGIKGIIDGVNVVVGNHRLMEKENISCDEREDTAVYVAADGKYIGCVVMEDEVKTDSKEAIDKLKKYGIENHIMLTGDKERIAARVAGKVGITKYFSELLPQDKVKKLEDIINEGNVAAFVGDGINDAPVLARAHVGIAMGGIGSDAAIEAADVVIMNDSLTKISDAVGIARRTMSKIKQNMIFVLAVKFAVLALAAFGYGNMWLAVFADVGVALLAILNAVRK